VTQRRKFTQEAVLVVLLKKKEDPMVGEATEIATDTAEMLINDFWRTETVVFAVEETLSESLVHI
jgi:hypothetical protein